MKLLTLLALVSIGLFASPSRADDATAARAHYRQGTKLYNLGRYLEAAKEYEAAYEAKDDPVLLFNIAQAYRLGGDAASTTRSFRAYLRTVPNAPNRVEVQNRLVELQKVLDQQARSKEGPPEGVISIEGKPTGKPQSSAPPIDSVHPTPESTTVEPTGPARTPETTSAVNTQAPRDIAARPGRTKKIAGLALMAGGVVSLVLGATFTALAKSTSDSIAQPGSVFMSADEDRLHQYQNLDIAFYVIGSVAAAGGLTLFLLGRSDAHKSVALAPILGIRQAGATLSVRF